MNLRLKIEQVNGKEDYSVIATLVFHEFENDLKDQIKEDTLDVFRDMFELETLSAKITEKDQTMEIKIDTHNTDKINILKGNMVKLFRKQSGLGNNNIHLN